MNNKGQTLIIFVILIPILILVAALVVDTGLMTFEKERYRGIIENGIEEYFDTGNVEETEKIFSLNDIPKEEYTIIVQENQIEVSLNTSIEAIFGKIINIEEYEIKMNYVGTKEGERVIINKKE
ncbi:TPA: Tad domain-containing protein [Candidatus Ventrenecus stercoripullorum]|nr:Tad domain-containing protein [Candidatus Ventrenecus stercoripullorum]